MAETAALTAGVWVGEFGVCVYDTRVASAKLIFPGVVMQLGHEKQMPRRVSNGGASLCGIESWRVGARRRVFSGEFCSNPSAAGLSRGLLQLLYGRSLYCRTMGQT